MGASSPLNAMRLLLASSRPGVLPKSAQPGCYDPKEFPRAAEAYEQRMEAPFPVAGGCRRYSQRLEVVSLTVANVPSGEFLSDPLHLVEA